MKKTNKKLLLALGTLTTIAAPVAAVVSCGADKAPVTPGAKPGTTPGTTPGISGVRQYNLLPTYTGQVDQLLALGIKPGYYPYQLDQTDVFGYISHPEDYISNQANGGGTFKNDFKKALSALMPSKANRGTSWWNQQALDDGEKGSDPEYWQHMQGNVVMYEHYLLDDGAKAVDASTAPKHYDNPHTYIQTNFRESRDPFTRMPKRIVEGVLDQAAYDDLNVKEKAIVNQMLDAARLIEGYRDASGNITMDSSKAATGKNAVDNKPAPSGKAQRTAEQVEASTTAGDISWNYNDYFFAKSFHNDFLDNDQFMTTTKASGAIDATKAKAGTAAEWVVNQNGETASYNTKTPGKNIFDETDNDKDIQLARLFFTATYQPSESKLQAYAYETYTGQKWNAAWVKATTTVDAAKAVATAANKVAHHPIYEQQEDFGGAPMFEGAQRDNMLYFYNTASKLTEAFTNPNKDVNSEDQKAFKLLTDTFGGENSAEFKQIQGAQGNANEISNQLRTRMANIKRLVDKQKVSGKNPTFGLITLAPGEGSTTVQSSSKYSFLYNELGFTQPTPTNLETLSTKPGASTPGHETADKGHDAREAAKMTLFNMDDNGWWWNLGDGTDASVATNAAEFAGKFDLGLVTANDTQYNDLKHGVKGAFATMFKKDAIKSLTGKTGEAGIDELKVDYNLWNEGLKTPFVMNMMLDKITDMLVKKYDNLNNTDADVTNAYSWGSYWTNDYLSDTKS